VDVCLYKWMYASINGCVPMAEKISEMPDLRYVYVLSDVYASVCVCMYVCVYVYM